MRFLKWRIEKAEYVDDLEEIEYRFGCFLCEMTGSRLSKTNYPLGVMVSCANDYQQEICEECREEQQEICEECREEQQGEWQEHFSNGCWHYDCPFCDDGYAVKERDEHPANYCSNCGKKLGRTVSKTEIVEEVKNERTSQEKV